MMCIYVLIVREWSSSRYHRRPINKILVTASTILFISVSAVRTLHPGRWKLVLIDTTQHWITNVIRAFNALVADGGSPNGSSMSYGRVSDTLDVVGRGALYSFEIVIADVIMVRRPSLVDFETHIS